ncbi:MAG: hypothetical protein M1839_008166 [Geoglossum umbratile]|nr:MAG: hypothetical protein M1839_008166 [Geoglossum umbratile]
MSSQSTATRTFIIRPLDGDNQIYDDVPVGATVRDLKERIFVRHGVQVQNQKLIYGPEVMTDTRTLESYNIREGFVIRLLTIVHSQAPPPPYQPQTDERSLRTVFIKTASGNTVRLENIKLAMTVKAFREEYCQKTGQEAEYCRLIFAGKELEDVKVGRG